MSSIFKYKAGSHIDWVGGRTLTPTGVTYKVGDKGHYGAFGGGSYLTASSSLLPATGAFSVIAFAKVGRNVTLGTDRAALISPNAFSTYGIKLSENDGTTGKPILALANANLRYFNYTHDKKWHCFIFTIPGSANADIASSALYVDGISQSTGSTAQTDAQNRTMTYLGGGNTSGKGADIAYLEVLNHVVTQQEIDAYQAMFESLKQTAKAKRNFIGPDGATATAIKLREDFSDTPVGGLPREWVKGTGTYTVQELTADVVSGSLRLPKGYKFLRCDVAGTISLPSEFARNKRFEFDVFKGWDANGINIYFIAANKELAAATYGVQIDSAETFILRTNNPSYTKLIQTAASYITINTWHRVRIDVTATTFTVYLKGGALSATAGCDGWHKVVASSGANPATDSTYNTSKFFVLDLDALDRVGNIVITEL